MSTGAELRKKFLDYFGQQDHLILPSASLIPKNDPSLLFTVAGMVPFKPYYQGKEVPPHPRIATSQKCLRTADLECVGKTARHHTFFEMLGNFSFGDYFKKEAIAWSWEFLTKELGLSPKDLIITVYHDDDEAARIWHESIGVPRERIVPLGEDSNFWAAGPVGPCGPCSEIIVDLGPDRGCGSPDCNVECDCDRHLEVWNLVFTEFNRDENGNLSELPRQNIDTGMGLERIASVLQGVPTNFETDLIFPLIQQVAGIAGVTYGASHECDVALKVISDHARAVAFLIADGVLPSNEGRGYVLRRILRRAVRYGRLIGISDVFLHQITAKVIALYQDPYHELQERSDYIQKIVSLEEERFGETLEQGLQILQEYLERLENTGEKRLPGDVAFRLYDTFGFPLEMTQEILEERGLAVDVEGFQASMNKQRERARAAWLNTAPADSFRVCTAFRCSKTDFLGYDTLSTRSQIQLLVSAGEARDDVSAGDDVEIIIDRTPFYPESGGQVGDKGIIAGPDGEAVINDTKTIEDGVIIHYGRITRGTLHRGDLVHAQVDERLRQATARNHTATHLLHRALREVLGDHVQQMGSLVTPERLRFDFSHFSSLSQKELEQVERIVNEKILDNIFVNTFQADRQDPRVQDAVALFGEKYGDVVRVVEIGNFSKELCGGTHVHRTSELAAFKILTESGIGTGVRRIEAITGEALWNYWNDQARIIQDVTALLKAEPNSIPSKVKQLLQQLHDKDKELEQLRSKLMRSEVDELLDKVVDVNGVKFLAVKVHAQDMDSLRSLGDLLKERLGSGVAILGSILNDKVGLVSFVTSDLIKDRGLHAGKLIREVARIVDGGGGGKPEMAQAGGKNTARLDEALLKGREILLQQLQQ